MASYGKSFEAKGKAGQHKRYFKGRYPKSNKKGRSIFELPVGDLIVFRVDSKILVGVVSKKLSNERYEVAPCQSNLCEEYLSITAKNMPKLVDTLKIPFGDLKVMSDVLTVWDYSGEFLALSPGRVIHIQRNYIWIKPHQDVCQHAVKVSSNDICVNPYKDLQGPAELVQNDIDPSALYIISSFMKITQTELQTIYSLYSSTLKKLHSTNESKKYLDQQLSNLQMQYQMASSTVMQLRQSLTNAQGSAACRANTLQQIVSEQKECIDKYNRDFAVLSTEMLKLRETFEIQSKKLTTTTQQWNADRMKLQKLQTENELLQSEVATLSKTVQTERNQREAIACKSMEVRPNTSSTSGAFVMTRQVGSNTRPTAFLPVVPPEVPASLASAKSIENRAKQLGQMLELISSPKEASDQDVVAVLANYLKRNPSIAATTVDAAKLCDTSVTELSPTEAVDLKVLLSLPMSKFRSLRTFLKNIDIDIMPSEKAMRQELQERRNIYFGNTSNLEVGTTTMKKTASAEMSQVAFVRVKSLKDHVRSIITQYKNQGILQEDEQFEGKVWLKIGGDKGGSSTKLAMQVANIPLCNSSHNTYLLGMFEAFDSYENLHSVFGPFAGDLLLLQEDTFRLGVSNSQYALNIFLFGDYEFLCKVIGHMGASATYPCLWCHVRLSELSYNNGPHAPMLWDEVNMTFQSNPNWPTNRTPDSLQLDLAQNKGDPRRGGDRRANGASHHSIAEDQLLPITTNILNIVPPSLHIMLGLVVRFYKLLEVYCRCIDQESLEERDAELHQEWETESVKTKEAELKYLKCKDKVKEEEELLTIFKKAQTATRQTENIVRPQNVRCSMPLCALTALGAMGDVEWIQCTQCGTDYDSGWFHFTCLRLDEHSAATFTTCPICQGQIETEQDVLKFQKKQISDKKSEMAEAKSVYDLCKSKLNAVYERVLMKRGPTETALNDILENELKVQKQAYHSQCFVGNHCKIILKQSDKLLTVFSNDCRKAKFSELFSRLRDIFSLFEARFLTSEEITRLCHLCWKFGSWFPVAFPDEKIPPKLHFLVAHIPEFVVKCGTIGLLGEQGLESIHACLNAEERTYSSVRERKDRLFHIFNQHSQKSLADHSKMKVIKRKCSIDNCSGRYKILDGVRKCQKCGTAASSSNCS